MSKGAIASAAAAVLCLIGAVAVADWSSPWLVIGAVGFGWEAFTLNRKAKGDTLSETVWRPKALWARISIAIFMVWLTLHWVFGL
jgi:hypothetical protein